MGCTASKKAWQDQASNRRVIDTAFDYRRPQAARSKVRPSAEPSSCGNTFQSIAVGRRTTFGVPPQPQNVDPQTYKRLPDMFTQEMERDYAVYKACHQRSIDINKGYNATRKRLGPKEQWPQEEHVRMQRLCEGNIDSNGKRIRASAMLHECDQSVSLQEAMELLVEPFVLRFSHFIALGGSFSYGI
jgi:hypothetical protein